MLLSLWESRPERPERVGATIASRTYGVNQKRRVLKGFNASRRLLETPVASALPLITQKLNMDEQRQ